MKTLVSLYALILIAINSKAQKAFKNNGRLFIVDNVGYKTSLGGYYHNGSVDDLLSLPKNGLSLGGTIHYFFHKNWGMYLDGQYDEYSTQSRNNNAGSQLAEALYKEDYFLSSLEITNGSTHKKSLRFIIGPSYSIEQQNFMLRIGIGLGITTFRATQTAGYLKEKNSNQNYRISFYNEGAAISPSPFTVQAHGQLGYRWHRRWGSIIGAKLANFDPGFDYRARRTNLYTGQTSVDQQYSYHKRISDFTWTAGMMYVIGIKDR